MLVTRTRRGPWRRLRSPRLPVARWRPFLGPWGLPRFGHARQTDGGTGIVMRAGWMAPALLAGVGPWPPRKGVTGWEAIRNTRTMTGVPADTLYHRWLGWH